MAYYMHMASILGARALVLGGSPGGLAEGMTVGDLVVPDVVTGNDSAAYYSRHGAEERALGAHGPEVAPDEDLATALAVRLTALHPSAPLWRGGTVTCEMIGAETAEDVADWSAAGFRAVEMEAAVVCAVGAAFGVPGRRCHLRRRLPHQRGDGVPSDVRGQPIGPQRIPRSSLSARRSTRCCARPPEPHSTTASPSQRPCPDCCLTPW